MVPGKGMWANRAEGGLGYSLPAHSLVHTSPVCAPVLTSQARLSGRCPPHLG